MIKKVLFFLILLFTLTIQGQGQSGPGFDYLIEVNIDIVDADTYTLYVSNPISDELYRDEYVGFKFIICNENNITPPYFKVQYDFFNQNSRASVVHIDGAQDPIITIPPPPTRTPSTANCYEFIPDHHYLQFNLISNDYALEMTSEYFWSNLPDPKYYPITSSIYKEIIVKDPAPDLEVFPVNAELIIGDGILGQIQSTCVVSNVGKKISPQTVINHYISTDTIIDKQDIFLSSREISSLEPAQSQEVRIGYRHLQNNMKPEVEYYLLYSVDPGNMILELNESNNVSYLPLSGNKLLQKSIQLYPNPARNEISISEIPEKIQIYDMYGLLIGEKKYSDRDSNMKTVYTHDISKLNSGMYYFHIYKGKQRIIKTFVKE
ncbi:T9SS type A sorting domain-containing protein [Aquimarina megaterium]|uniref:T9SS type A sorting domain-containing protein n=1 Tax=Aquimarina megaterium TaxID=1443666 RepID=UPI00094383C4|nr:T9SS type A sorting domain-containing protein [Aquimarina megaterium]